MNKYKAIIDFEGCFDKESLEAVNIPDTDIHWAEPNGSSGLRMPDDSWLISRGNEKHELEISYKVHANNKDAEAHRLKDIYLSHISLFLNTPIRKSEVKKIICYDKHNKPQTNVHLVGIDAKFTVPQKVQKDDLILANKVLNNIDTENDKITHIIDRFFRIMGDVDKYSKYWQLYQFFSEIFASSGAGNERTRVNNYLNAQNLPNNQFFKNDKTGRNHLVIAVRDAIAHHDATFDGGQKLDVSVEIDNAIQFMRTSIRDEIMQRFRGKNE